jgi:integrase
LPQREADASTKGVVTIANKTVNNTLTLLGRILDDARREGYLRVSPMADHEKVKFRCKPGRALTPTEAQKFLAHCGDGLLKTVVLIGLLAGLRAAELFALRWSDIDFENDLIHIRRSIFWLSRKHGQVAAGAAGVRLPGPEVWLFSLGRYVAAAEDRTPQTVHAGC